MLGTATWCFHQTTNVIVGTKTEGVAVILVRPIPGDHQGTNHLGVEGSGGAGTLSDPGTAGRFRRRPAPAQMS
jgi:hypothetical protein